MFGQDPSERESGDPASDDDDKLFEALRQV